MSEKDTPRRLRYFIYVPVGDGAAMTVPTIGDDSLEWSLRYAPPHKDTSMAAASCLSSYVYLLTACTKEEAWRRIKLLRDAFATTAQEPQP